mmetsp:Transcript_24729/g.39184  ORF Transcript_24729/g.39184 Transcript_24729/m.39184 type:complete len:132 (-) Transcript_24729:342-737(-)
MIWLPGMVYHGAHNNGTGIQVCLHARWVYVCAGAWISYCRQAQWVHESLSLSREKNVVVSPLDEARDCEGESCKVCLKRQPALVKEAEVFPEASASTKRQKIAEDPSPMGELLKACRAAGLHCCGGRVAGR